MGITQIGHEGINWIYLAEGSVQRRVLVNLDNEHPVYFKK
jgi:hypothetical protein